MRKIKYLLWGTPVALVSLFAAISLCVQSCSIPVIIRPEGKFVKLDSLYAPFIIYGVILFIGTCFSIFTLIQVTKISRKLKELGYSI